MKTGGDLREHLVDLTDGGSRPGDSGADKQPQHKIEENYSEESSEEDDKDEEKISWATAEKGIETVIKFVEQNHSFSLQDVMHAHMVQNIFITKKLQSRTQGDIRKYLKKAIEASSSAADAVEAASVPSTSSAADDSEVVEMNE
ncbi:putative Jerky protein-like 56 [Homarus americanus]|uniref:Putative Jerky protein-like 56 n=1 Tax=Homarus americanus TaxID=6706 RepID=A0A8J5N6W4_HOMAM|nr:putative Jerky protein-like 56 [Homarus americanus]